MSCNTTFGYNSLVGNCFTTAPATSAVPAAPFDSVQFNDSGDFGGDSSFTFDVNTTTLNVPRIIVNAVGNTVGIGTATPAYPLDVIGSAKMTTLRDTTNSIGTAGQLLSSTGAALQWVAAPTPVVPGAPVNSVQFNNAGAFGGDSDFTFDLSTNTVSVPDISLSNYVTHAGDTDTRVGFPANDEIALRTNGVDRVFIGTTGNVGVGTITPAYPLDVNGSAKFTTIRDTANSVGTAGQVLSSTGSALSWIAAGASLPCSVLKETKTAGTSSTVVFPRNVATTQKRQLNVTTNSNLAVTVSGTPNWTFTIPTAGTYLFKGRAFVRADGVDSQTISSFLVLNNNTLGLGSVIVGDSAKFGWIHASNQVQNFVCHLDGIYTISGVTVFTLDHVVLTTGFAASGGIANNLLGYQETYASLVITKLA